MDSVISGMASTSEMQALFRNKVTIEVPSEKEESAESFNSPEIKNLSSKVLADHTISERNEQLRNTLLRDFFLRNTKQ